MKGSLDEQGLTLIEMMVSILITVILIVASYGLLDSGMILYQTSDAHMEQVQNMRIAMENIGRDIRRAKSVYFDTVNKELTITFPVGIERYGMDNESIYGPSGLNGKKMWRTTKSNPLASYLSNFNVYKDNQLITVIIEADTSKGSPIILKNSFTLRN